MNYQEDIFGSKKAIAKDSYVIINEPIAIKEAYQGKRYYQEFVSITPTYHSYYSRPLEAYNSIKRLPIPKRPDNRKLKRLQLALNYLLITSPIQHTYDIETKKHYRFKLNFITLTLSEKQKHSDKWIKERMLEPFLKWIMRKGATGYVWKAETQKNGNIHFHITTNKFIKWESIRLKWNGIQIHHGYLDSYYKKNDHYDANSTDVKSVKNDDRAFRYMCKYLLKQEDEKRKIEGHDYGYSRNLARVKIIFETNDPAYNDIAQYLKTLETGKSIFDFVTVVFTDHIDLSVCPPALRDAIIAAVLPSDTAR